MNLLSDTFLHLGGIPLHRNLVPSFIQRVDYISTYSDAFETHGTLQEYTNFNPGAIHSFPSSMLASSKDPRVMA